MVALKKHVEIGGVVISITPSLFRYFLVCMLIFLVRNVAYAAEAPQVMIKQSSQQVWQRQHVLITVKVDTADPFARLEADEFQQKGFLIVAYPFQRSETNNQTHLILKWAVFPFTLGERKLQLPKIVYRPNRGRKQVLKTKELSLQVRKLPLYIPPTMPVGKIKLESEWNRGKIVFINELLEWNLNVIGDNVAMQTMPPISRQIVSTKSLQVFPIKHVQKTLKTEEGIVNQRNYTIPLKALQNGIFNLPTIEVQYFEPISGKLEKVSLTQPLKLSLYKWFFWFITVGLLFFLIWILWEGSAIFKAWLSVFLKRKQAITLFEKAKNYPQLRSAVNQLSLVEGWEANLPLSKFVEVWEKKFGKSVKLEKKINSFQVQYFSSEGDKLINNNANNSKQQ